MVVGTDQGFSVFVNVTWQSRTVQLSLQGNESEADLREKVGDLVGSEQKDKIYLAS